MPKKKESSQQITVPPGTPDPIAYVLKKGGDILDLAKAWGLRSTDAIYRLKRYEYPPKPKTAQRMAESFGWTAGQVFDHWLARVKR